MDLSLQNYISASKEHKLDTVYLQESNSLENYNSLELRVATVENVYIPMRDKNGWGPIDNKLE